MLQSVTITHRASLSPSHPLPDVFVDECKSDLVRVATPSTGVHVVVRYGPHLAGGLDIHALGPQLKVHRKLVRGGQSTVFARLALGTYQAVLGKPASELEGRSVALRDLWGPCATQRLEAQLASASDAASAVIMLKSAIAERLGHVTRYDANTRLAHSAARRLHSRKVGSVAKDLGITDRHLRRVFREVLGLSPKAFCKLTRFERALRAAKDGADSNWSDIAVSAGYYDQAHLIADFRSISGVSPRKFLAEVSSHG